MARVRARHEEINPYHAAGGHPSPVPYRMSNRNRPSPSGASAALPSWHLNCQEFSFRWDHRKITDSERTEIALKMTEGKRLSYRRPTTY